MISPFESPVKLWAQQIGADAVRPCMQQRLHRLAQKLTAQAGRAGR